MFESCWTLLLFFSLFELGVGVQAARLLMLERVGRPLHVSR